MLAQELQESQTQAANRIRETTRHRAHRKKLPGIYTLFTANFGDTSLHFPIVNGVKNRLDSNFYFFDPWKSVFTNFLFLFKEH